MTLIPYQPVRYPGGFKNYRKDHLAWLESLGLDAFGFQSFKTVAKTLEKKPHHYPMVRNQGKRLARFPSSHDHEFSGIVTRDGVRYIQGSSGAAAAFHSYCYTFHSHPNGHKHADFASIQDLFFFFWGYNARHIIIGSKFVIILEKTVQSMGPMKHFRKAHRNQGPKLILKYGDAYPEGLMKTAFDLSIPRTLEVESWAAIIMAKLGIQIRLIPKR